MNIQCTKKLLDKLPITPVQPEDVQPLFGWHANLIQLGRRQLLFLLNDATRYPLFVYGVKAANLKDLGALFRQALTETWLAEGIDQQTIDRYLESAGPARITRSTNRSCTSNMVQLMRDLPYYLDGEDLIDNSQLVQTRLSMRFSNRNEKIGKDFLKPREAFMEAFERLGEESVVQNGANAGDATDAGAGAGAKLGAKAKTPEPEQAFVFRVELACCGQKIWRRVAVPARITFSQLHQVLQAAFTWQNCHLHQFQIQNDKGEIVAESKTGYEDEFLEETKDIERFSERKKLTHYLPECRQLTYLYDFGDDWLHLIELEQTIEGYDDALPACLDGAGDAPPEDVGGEPGYEDFLETIQSTATDKESVKERKSLLSWAKMQGWQSFDIDAINQRLKKIGSKMKRA